MELRWEPLDGRDGHTAGRELLAKMVQPLPQIKLTDRGKPYFAEGSMHFSVSHTKNHVFCAVSHKNIGIDAEETDRKIDLRLAQRYLSPGEMARFQASPDPRDTLLRLWVLKESWAKLTGRGWGDYLKGTDFDPETVAIIDGCYVAVLEEEEKEYAV